jgi:sphingolipid delta-4 desaturase
MKNTLEFEYTKTDDPHVQRRRDIIKAHPEVKKLIGNHPPTAIYIVLIVSTQLMSAYFVSQYSWPIVVALAYIFGAFLAHALFIMIHECTHNLVLKKSVSNRFMGIFCDIPLLVPSAMGFRKYHLIHHKHMGEYSYDPDIASKFESDMVGNGSIRKAIWLSLFFVSQALRPLKVKYYNPFDLWSVLNTVLIIGVNIAIYFTMGPMALLYLGLSTLFGLGLHPLGGRWIQEHFVTKEGQETYSYYGPLNKLTFNIGYHNEHHDIMNIPWSNLKKLNQIAPEFYTPLKSYNSWTKLVLEFIFSPKLSSYSRVVRPDRHPKKINLSSTSEEAQPQL